MKTEFKAKFLQHINKKRQDEGFTLIELLVVIIIIGILSAIALPSFLSQANKAKQTEAKQYVSSINKGIQAYYAENTKFTQDIALLGLGLKTQTTNYSYTIGPAGVAPNGGATSAATPNADTLASLKGYAGAVAVTAADASGASGTQTILCETTKPGAPAAINLTGSDTFCGTEMTLVTK